MTDDYEMKPDDEAPNIVVINEDEIPDSPEESAKALRLAEKWVRESGIQDLPGVGPDARYVANALNGMRDGVQDHMEESSHND